MSELLTRVDRALVRLFEAGPTGRSRRRARYARLGASAVVSLTGVGLLIPNLSPVVLGTGSPVGTALAVLGVVVCLGLVAAGVLLYRSEFSTPNAVRIAVWNFLGLVVLGVVLLAHGAVRGTLGTVTVADALAGGNVLAISAAAHVIIGVHDARRVRAEQLAREREKFAVLSRVLRHNLRNEATVLVGQADRLAGELDDPALADLAATLSERSRAVGGLAEKTKAMVGALERQSAPNARFQVRQVVADALADVTDSEAVTVDVPADLWLWADDGVTAALSELIENAIEHGGSRVRVSADVTTGADGDETVRIAVADDGDGVPASERNVVTGEVEITQLTHSSGLGLWVARSVAEAAGGHLTFDVDGEWTVVGLVHQRADPPADVDASGDATVTAARAPA